MNNTFIFKESLIFFGFDSEFSQFLMKFWILFWDFIDCLESYGM